LVGNISEIPAKKILAFINICSIIYIYDIKAAIVVEHAYYLSNKDIIIIKPCRKYYGRLINRLGI